MKKLMILLAMPLMIMANPYDRCAGCHGIQGEKQALGKSARITGQEASLTVEQLTSYRDSDMNLYGMGKLMTSQVRDMSEEDIKAMAEYIEALKVETK